MGTLRAVIALVFALLFALPLLAEDLAQLRAASERRPQHPTLLYKLGVALAVNGKREEALDALERVAAMGMVYDAANNGDLVALGDDPRFRAIVASFARNAEPIGTATPAFTIPEKGLIPEGLAYDSATGRFFVSSVRTRAIHVAGPAGRTRLFASELPSGVFGMVVDGKRGVLWATTTQLAQKKSALLRIDLRSGRVVETIRVEGAHHFGDVALTDGGEVLVSDGGSPTIFVLRDHALVPFVTGPFVALQGMAAAGNVLYAADYSKGLFAVDLRTRDVHPLRVPRDVSLLGVDGLYVSAPRTLVATQNGTNPNRIVRIRLTADGLGVAGVETLLANVPSLGDPTLGVVAKGAFYFNAAGQWDLFDDPEDAAGKAKDEQTLRPAMVLRVALP